MLFEIIELPYTREDSGRYRFRDIRHRGWDVEEFKAYFEPLPRKMVEDPDIKETGTWNGHYKNWWSLMGGEPLEVESRQGRTIFKWSGN